MGAAESIIMVLQTDKPRAWMMGVKFNTSTCNQIGSLKNYSFACRRLLIPQSTSQSAYWWIDTTDTTGSCSLAQQIKLSLVSEYCFKALEKLISVKKSNAGVSSFYFIFTGVRQSCGSGHMCSSSHLLVDVSFLTCSAMFHYRQYVHHYHFNSANAIYWYCVLKTKHNIFWNLFSGILWVVASSHWQPAISISGLSTLTGIANEFRNHAKLPKAGEQHIVLDQNWKYVVCGSMF